MVDEPHYAFFISPRTRNYFLTALAVDVMMVLDLIDWLGSVAVWPAFLVLGRALWALAVVSAGTDRLGNICVALEIAERRIKALHQALDTIATGLDADGLKVDFFQDIARDALRND